MCKRIIENEIAPRFKLNDYAGGLSAGVAAVMAATKGEYKGTGKTTGQRRHGSGSFTSHGWFPLLVALFILIGGFKRRRHGYYGGWTVSSGGFNGWSSGGGGWSGGGGGGFSGGGGSSGGGGASGSW